MCSTPAPLVLQCGARVHDLTDMGDGTLATLDDGAELRNTGACLSVLGTPRGNRIASLGRGWFVEAFHTWLLPHEDRRACEDGMPTLQLMRWDGATVGAPLVVGADVCHLFSAAGRGGEPLLMASVDGRGVCVFDWSAHQLRLRQQLAQEPLADGVPPGGGQGARVGRIVARHAQVVVVYEREEDGRRRHTASTSTTSSSYLCSSTNGAVCAFFFILQQRTERRCCRGKPPQ